MVELIICEKPSAAVKIATALADAKPVKKVVQKVSYYEITHNGKEILVGSAVGHLFGLAEKEKSGWTYPVFDIEWKPTYEGKGMDYVKPYVTVLGKLSKRADSFTVACDYDVEGELIGWNVLRFVCKKKEGNRMKFSTLTKGDLEEAYDKKLKHIDHGQALAGETRHKLDWFYGINLSRALTASIKAVDSFKIMSVGRVQGPSLKMVVEREKEIAAFKPVPFWQLQLFGSSNKKELEAWHVEDKFWDEKQAADVFDKVKKEKNASVTSVKKKEFDQAPPHPFDLTTLQTESYAHFGISPKEALGIAQTLYLGGAISYPRTSSQQLDPKLGFAKILKQLSGQDGYAELCSVLLKKKSLNPNNGKKVDPAHPAIYPTGSRPKGLKEREMKVYDLIVRRFLATFADAATRESMKIVLDVKGEGFVAEGKRTVAKGWHVFYGPYVKFKDVELPALKEKDSVDVSKIDKLSKETQPPKRYTQSSIIKELEKRNLGTKCLTSNNFVKVNSDSKVHTENIAELFDTLYANFPIQDDSSMKIALNDKKTCFSFDGFDETRSCFNLVSKRKLNKGEAVYRIEYIDGTFIEATSEHPFLVLDNDKVRYLQAEKLSKGMKSICSDTFPDKTGEVICTWEDFLNKCNEKSKLYAVTDELKSLRKKLKLTQYDFEERYHVQQPRLSVYERKKSVPLYLLNRFGLSQPDSFTSANKLVSIKNPFPLRMTSSLARLLANLVGDCSIDRERIKKENVYDFRYHNTNLELINRFISDIKNVFGITLVPQLAKPRPGHLQIYYVKVPAVVGRILAMLFEEVLTKNAYEKLHSDFYPEYVGALFDDEGHAADSEPKLFISNINFKLLERVRLMLNHLGIESKISKKQFKLYIRGRRNIHLFLEKIPIASVSKKQRLVNTLSAFYKYGNEESSPLKQYMILSALGKAANKDLTTKELVRQIGFNEPMLREHLKYLRKYGYVKQITRGISAYPRKKITYRLMIPIERTFYKYVGEQVVSRDFITKTIQSVTRVDYSGFVYDITNTPELPNFVLSNGVVVHNSTRADILDTLFKRGYANGKQIQVTQLGMQTAETLEKYVPEIMDDELTREFEDEMEQIRAGKVTEANVLKTAQEFLNKVLSKFKKHEKSIGEELLKAVQETRDEERTLGACQVCGEGTLKIIRSKKTKKIFAACDKYPECETTYPLPQGALVKPHDKSCEQCTFPMVMVIRRGRRPQMLCINPECPTKKLEEAAAKEAEKLAAGKLEKKCPECGSELVVRKSFYGMFIGCSGYPKCRHTEKLEKKDEFGKGKNVVKKKVKRKVKKKGKRKVKKK